MSADEKAWQFPWSRYSYWLRLEKSWDRTTSIFASEYAGSTARLQEERLHSRDGAFHFHASIPCPFSSPKFWSQCTTARSTGACEMSSSKDVTWQATAAARILEARKKKGRLGSKKSRGGCVTCKTRRIKCDETRPKCERCTTTGRHCEGYPDLPITKGTNSLIGRQLSQALGLSDDEKRTFDYFLSWTAPRLAGMLDKDFWCGQVLQLAQREPLILDSLLALSTLYEHPQYMKSFLTPAHGPKETFGNVYTVHPAISRPNIDEHHAKALKHYNRAIRKFDQKMSEGTASPLLALVSCALFICVEIIRDNVFGGVSLFITGCSLTRQFSTCPDGMCHELYNAIRQMFARLSVLAASIGHPAEHDIVEWSGNSPVDPGGYDTVAGARTMLFRLLGETHATMRLTGDHRKEAVAEGTSNGVPAYANNALSESELRDLPPPPPRPYELPNGGYTTALGKWSQDLYEVETDRGINAPWHSEDPGDGQHEDLYELAWKHGDISAEHRMIMQLGDRKLFSEPSHIQRRRSRLQERWARWHESFRRLYPYDAQEDEAAATLLMHYQLALIMMHGFGDQSQMSFDECTSNFEEILRLSEIYVQKRSGENPTFTFEVGTVPPLYWLATKCRIPSLRRRAVELLLKAPAKECMWSSRSSAEVLARLISVEEEGLGHPAPSLAPPGPGGIHAPVIDDSILPSASQRVHNLGILVNKPAGRFDIRVTRYNVNPVTGARERVFSDYAI